MRIFLVKRCASRGLREVKVYDEGESKYANVAKELAELEGFEAQVFMGEDLVDVAGGSPQWFDLAEAA